MTGQVVATAEALPTFPTFVGPLPSMDPLVFLQVGAMAEAPPTFPTLVRLLPALIVLRDHQV